MYHLSVKPISRSDGRSATAAAAYRSASLITDERTGEVHNYTRKGDVVHSEILVPSGAPAWAQDRTALWNAAEAAEKRKDARVARDYEVAIPKELTREQGIELVRDFSQDLVDRQGVAVDFNVHRDDLRKWDGSEKGWQGYHAHILTSTRKLGREGFGDKADPELSNAKRKSLGLCDGPAEIEEVRVRWEVLANRHLERAGVVQRIDRRSLKEQGIEGEATVHLGPGVTALERDGLSSRLGDLNRRVIAERHDAQELVAQIAEMEKAVVQGVVEPAPLPVSDKPRAVRPRIDLSALDRDDDSDLGQERLAAEDKARQEQVGQEQMGQQQAAEVARLATEAEEKRQRVKREGAKQQETVLTSAEREEARAALKAAMAQQVLERAERVREVLKLAGKREARRQRELDIFVQHEPQAPNLAAAPWAQKGYEELCKTWERSRVALAKLVEQAKQLAERLLEAAQPERLVRWAQGYLMRERPDLVQPYAQVQKAEKAEQAAAEGVKAEPGGTAPKRDWNRYKQLQQELAAKGRQSLQERGVLRDPNEPERKPREHEREIKPKRERPR